MMTLPNQIQNQMRNHLEFLYGNQAARTLERLEALISLYAIPPSIGGWSEKDAILITYGDQISTHGEVALQTLHRFAKQHLEGVFSGIHILPFYPYTSDDGFSVVDFQQVKEEWGTWEDIQGIAKDFRLMADLVCNHVSASSMWFQGFLQDHPVFKDFFTVVEPGTDLSQVFRPRALPLLTPFPTPSGEKLVWTTFSTDQIDLNFANPDVLLEVMDALLFYVKNGAQLIRLDAVGFIWKIIGTSCMHLEGAHRIIKLMRLVMDAAAPQVVLITETNVPHKDNISYFGNGTDEAQMVYQFPLPPLTLHTFRTGDASKIAAWAAGLRPPTQQTTFFNFLASHDGMGLVPANGILSPEEITALVQQAQDHGGQVNYKDTLGGPLPYELCLTLFDALNDSKSSEAEATQISRFMAANAVLLSLQGVPGIYIHSILGSSSDHQGLAESGINRRLNRHKFTGSELNGLLNDKNSRASKILARYAHLLKIRASHPAFHPNAAQEIKPSKEVLHIVRGGTGKVHCLINVTNAEQTSSARGMDLITGKAFSGQLSAYQAAWVAEL
jgi:glucosylglycerate phosphorylase